MSAIVNPRRRAKQPSGTLYCCVVKCSNSVKNTAGESPPVTFHCFPGKWYEKDRRKAWIAAVRRNNPDGTPWEPTKRTVICSRHFVDNKVSNIQTSLSYIPTIFPEVYRKKAPDTARNKRWTNRRAAKENIATVSIEEAVCSAACDDIDEMPLSDVVEMATGDTHLVVLAALASEAQKLPTHVDVGTQTAEPGGAGNLKVLLSMADSRHAATQVDHACSSAPASEIYEVELCSAEKNCCKDPHVPGVNTTKVAATGSWRRKCSFEGFRTLEKSEKALQALCGITMTVFFILLNLLPEQRQRTSDVSQEDRVAMFLMKLKLGISLTAIGTLFGVTKSTASRIFHVTLNQLHAVTSDWIFVPPRVCIKETMPPCFKKHYANCTFIIDCTEVKTEIPSDPEQQHYLYSHYKGCYTLKWLVGIVPNGMICFLSKPYGGRHSDSLITQDSGFLAHVQPNDVVLSNKGFPTIRTTLADKGAVLVMPPFNVGGGQLSVDDMQSTFNIAQVRVHVERAIQRLKLFNVLNHRVPLLLIPHMGKIAHVCACLVNFQSPIIKPKAP